MEFTLGHSSMASEDLDHARFAPILAENVKRLRKEANINKKRFALMVGIGRPFLNKIEAGAADPRLSVIVKMADALETTPGELLQSPRKPCNIEEEPSSPMPHHARLR